MSVDHLWRASLAPGMAQPALPTAYLAPLELSRVEELQDPTGDHQMAKEEQIQPRGRCFPANPRGLTPQLLPTLRA